MSIPRFLLDEHVWGGLVQVGKELGTDVRLVQTDRSLLSRALRNIVQQYTAESFKNTYRFIQEFS